MADITGTNSSETIDQDQGVTQNSDSINALGGNDFVFGLGGGDIIHGGTGNDDIFGDLGFTNPPGPGGDDLFGDAGNDILRGEGGDDELEGGADADQLLGGDGDDTASYEESPFGVTVSLVTGTGSGGDAAGDTLSSIENLKGSGEADTLIGNDLNNNLNGMEGADILQGGLGNDFYQVLGGDDVIVENADEGHDVLVAFFAAPGTITLADNVEDLFLASENELAIDAIGNKSNNIIQADDGANRIEGRGGDDTLKTGDGNDVLIGGNGRDKLTGGADRDIFDFNALSDTKVGAKRDAILDFKRGNNLVGDEIDLSGIDAKNGGGDQKFKFIGRDDFHGSKGELRYIDNGKTCVVQGDVNGDAKADFEILVKVGGLGAGDFVL